MILFLSAAGVAPFGDRCAAETPLSNALGAANLFMMWFVPHLAMIFASDFTALPAYTCCVHGIETPSIKMRKP
jgi:hypothetical protein